MEIYYTYIYLDPRLPGNWETSLGTFDSEPFYVGNGKGRRFRHLLSKRNLVTNSHRNHRVLSIMEDGFLPTVRILKEGLTQEEALSFESLMIRELGTRYEIPGIKSGPLTNLKLDGIEQRYSLESREKMKFASKKRVRKPHSEETKEKMRLNTRARDPEVRANLSMKLKGRKLSDAHCQFLSKLHKGKKISDEQKRKASLKLKGRIRTEEARKKMSESQICTWKLQKQDTLEFFEVRNVRAWCLENGIKPGTFGLTFKSGRFHKGFRLIEKTHDPRPNSNLWRTQ